MKKLYVLLFMLTICSAVYASCPSGQVEIIVKIVPDAFPDEISWSISDGNAAILASGTSVGDTICVASGSCLMFSIYDSFGDGIFTPGGYWLYSDGILIGQGGNYTFSDHVSMNCPPGNFCSDTLSLTQGTHTALFDNTWYAYTPTVSGTYSINTCSLNTCNTKIWVYSSCPALPYPEGIQGTFAYNDDDCGTQAKLNVVLMAGNLYYIRIGDNLDSCTGSIDFDFSYVGPIQGCTDPAACNFNPLAVVDDSSCIYFPNPLCEGPDLEIDSTVFVQSLSLQTKTASACDVAEGCVTGYGTRYVISFTSRINNIGTLDYYIGNESTQPGMFNTNNCHGHAHYEGYGDYRLFDSNGVLVPAGHKNGYCVIDLCGFGQYTCSNMGISAGCYDAYGSGTQCQWIDITDVPTGDYRIAVIINSKHLPDALGRHETNYVNNATQICVHINQNGSGPPSYTILPSCTPYIDCMNIPGGNAELDCNSICNGPGVYGDVYANSVLDSQDVYTYLDMIQATMPAVNCNDLNRDGNLTVYDAALVNWCKRASNNSSGTPHNHCNFPRNIVNPNDVTSLAISNANFTDNYIDVELLSPLARVSAYQFTVSGITISSVVSLASPLQFPADVRFNSSTSEVFAISLFDSTLQRSNLAQPLVRIYFSAITDTVICISSITDIVNQYGERTVTNIYGGCVNATSTSMLSIAAESGIVIYPNPATDKTYIHVNAGNGLRKFIVTDVTGKKYQIPVNPISEHWYEMDVRSLARGIYVVRDENDRLSRVERFVKY